jgi:hypothetical protein
MTIEKILQQIQAEYFPGRIETPDALIFFLMAMRRIVGHFAKKRAFLLFSPNELAWAAAWHCLCLCVSFVAITTRLQRSAQVRIISYTDDA